MEPSNGPDHLTSELMHLRGDAPGQHPAEASGPSSVPCDPTSSAAQASQPTWEHTRSATDTLEGEGEKPEGTTYESYAYRPQRQSYSSQQSRSSQDAPVQSPQYAGPIPDEADSGISSNASTLSNSLTEQAYSFRHINGRRYHAEQLNGTEYYLPNDELELDRLDLQHHLFLLTLNGALHRAPLRRDIESVLDVGTGTGIWAIDFADLHPACVVVGTDLSPVQPPYIPPNCRFYIEDTDKPWSFDQPFDYIHARMLIVGIKSWAEFCRQAYTNLKPGGYIELQDMDFPPRCDDGTAPPDSPVMTWGNYIIQGSRNLGFDVEVVKTFPALLAAAGFVDIKNETYPWPMNSWPKDQVLKERGMWVMHNFLQGLQGFSMAIFTKGLGWKPAEVEVMASQVRAQTRDRKSHVYIPFRVVWARKPG